MSHLRKALNQLKYDERMVEWNYMEGILSKEEYKKHLEELSDVSHRAVKLTLEEETNHSDHLSSSQFQKE